MARSNNSIWNIALPIVIFLPMSYTAMWLFRRILEVGLIKPLITEHCPIPSQGKMPFQRQYLGGYIPWLEKLFCNLVAFFHPLFQPGAGEYTPFVIDFLVSFSATIIIPFLEASRSKRPLLLGFPTTLGMIYQLFTGGVTFPLYWVIFLAITRDHAAGSDIVQADAEAVLFGLIMGYFLPAFAMAYIATIEATAIWQIFPILIYVFKTLHLWFRPRRLHDSSGYRTVQATYLIIFLISSITHLFTFAAYKFDPQTSMAALLPPPEIPVAKAGQTAITSINLFLQWDAVAIFSSTALASIWFAESILEGLQLITWIVISSPILGPGATISGIFLWRETKLNHARQFYTPKLAKTQ